MVKLRSAMFKHGNEWQQRLKVEAVAADRRRRQTPILVLIRLEPQSADLVFKVDLTRRLEDVILHVWDEMFCWTSAPNPDPEVKQRVKG